MREILRFSAPPLWCRPILAGIVRNLVTLIENVRLSVLSFVIAVALKEISVPLVVIAVQKKLATRCLSSPSRLSDSGLGTTPSSGTFSSHKQGYLDTLETVHPRTSKTPDSHFRTPTESQRLQRELGDRPVESAPTLTFCEINEDLFNVSNEFSLAHCVSKDMSVSAGISLRFREKFGSQKVVLQQRQAPGGLAVLFDNGRFIYYLVTKKSSSDKPSYENLQASLLKLRDHVLSYQVPKLAIPFLGCGLDGLSWPKVRSLVYSCFADIDMELVVCYHSLNPENPPVAESTCDPPVSYDVSSFTENSGVSERNTLPSMKKRKKASFSENVQVFDYVPFCETPKLNDTFMPSASEWNNWLAKVHDF
ncbi:hypothetical protein NQ314_018001 [Rhamnusium bicolor]|uniref:Macro domain-containing protein n=1 Tax=Rhamnusium bicolor TaxID=1586634 RepID=A0AAV8WRZ4_9CUCU|nr:hypothetical protein NQ314_018001 [Rhamnusium bicolor]